MDSVPVDPLVSVVLPVHDTRPEFLRDAIESVRGQSESQWELVIVLDAATPACGSVASEMAERDAARIAVVGETGGLPRGSSAPPHLRAAHTRAPHRGTLGGG